MTTTVVIGLGNPLAGDEGIGERLAGELPRRYDCSGIEVIDLGTSLFSLIHVLPGKTKVVIVDCALMGERPGAIRRFTRDEARSVKRLRHFSLHEGDVLALIEIGEHALEGIPAIVFFGIEPETMEWGRGLSETLERRVGEYLERIAAEAGLLKRVSGDA